MHRTRQHDLLLVAAGKVANPEIEIARTEVNLGGRPGCRFALQALRDETRTPDAPNDRKNNVGRGRKSRKDALGLALLRQKSDSPARLQGDVGTRESNRCAVHLDRTGSERGEPYEGAEKRALSLSLEPCDAEDFAFAQRERNGLEASSRQSLGFENSWTRRLSGRRAALHFLRLAAAHHHFENVVIGRVLKPDRADAPAIAENGRALTEFADLMKPMRDVKDGRARGGRLSNEAEKPFGLG